MAGLYARQAGLKSIFKQIQTVRIQSWRGMMTTHAAGGKQQEKQTRGNDRQRKQGKSQARLRAKNTGRAVQISKKTRHPCPADQPRQNGLVVS
ncbi:hypothetical protein AH4AK4_2758 [Aeromonas hydrophila 4AK4]|nr:hypothetical protein AH4AK4_2758 [Aeromonas hydrophila 4AK4]